MLVETLLTEPRVERFNERIVGWLPGSTEIEFDMVPVWRPEAVLSREELTTMDGDADLPAGPVC